MSKCHILGRTIYLKYVSIFISLAVFHKKLSEVLSWHLFALLSESVKKCARAVWETGLASSRHDTYHPACDWCSASRPQCHARHIRLRGKQEVWERVTVLNPLSRGEGHRRCMLSSAASLPPPTCVTGAGYCDQSRRGTRSSRRPQNHSLSESCRDRRPDQLQLEMTCLLAQNKNQLARAWHLKKTVVLGSLAGWFRWF